ncbi:hypothetical protein RUM44_010172 [Polyplax serrata]|uniref:Uncharacterized protein n=1 Tax=Polyplax serrata TaxID=468196 RepID=A0ABR1AV31_POLSC
MAWRNPSNIPQAQSSTRVNSGTDSIDFPNTWETRGLLSAGPLKLLYPPFFFNAPLTKIGSSKKSKSFNDQFYLCYVKNKSLCNKVPRSSLHWDECQWTSTGMTPSTLGNNSCHGGRVATE